jgi:hypothetical protein
LDKADIRNVRPVARTPRNRLEQHQVLGTHQPGFNAVDLFTLASPQQLPLERRLRQKQVDVDAAFVEVQGELHDGHARHGIDPPCAGRLRLTARPRSPGCSATRIPSGTA